MKMILAEGTTRTQEAIAENGSGMVFQIKNQHHVIISIESGLPGDEDNPSFYQLLVLGKKEYQLLRELLNSTDIA